MIMARAGEEPPGCDWPGWLLHTGTGRQSCLSEAKLWEAGGWALILEKKEVSQRGKTQSCCVFAARKLSKHGKLISFHGTQFEGKAVLPYLYSSICLQLGEMSTSLRISSMNIIQISLPLISHSLAGICHLILETHSSHLALVKCVPRTLPCSRRMH